MPSADPVRLEEAIRLVPLIGPHLRPSEGARTLRSLAAIEVQQPEIVRPFNFVRRAAEVAGIVQSVGRTL